MGKKHKKKKCKLLFDSDKRYKTRGDFLISQYDPSLISLWCKTDEEVEEFKKFLVRQDEIDMTSSLLDEFDNSNKYYEKIHKEIYRKHDSIEDIIISFDNIEYYYHKAKSYSKAKKRMKKLDLGIATYTNCKRYQKKYLNNDKYRKSLKKIAKQEKSELEELRRLGFIRSKNPDDELEKLLENSSRVNMCLSDAYAQKHFIK